MCETKVLTAPPSATPSLFFFFFAALPPHAAPARACTYAPPLSRHSHTDLHPWPHGDRRGSEGGPTGRRGRAGKLEGARAPCRRFNNRRGSLQSAREGRGMVPRLPSLPHRLPRHSIQPTARHASLHLAGGRAQSAMHAPDSGSMESRPSPRLADLAAERGPLRPLFPQIAFSPAPPLPLPASPTSRHALDHQDA